MVNLCPVSPCRSLDERGVCREHDSCLADASRGHKEDSSWTHRTCDFSDKSHLQHTHSVHTLLHTLVLALPTLATSGLALTRRGSLGAIRLSSGLLCLLHLFLAASG